MDAVSSEVGVGPSLNTHDLPRSEAETQGDVNRESPCTTGLWMAHQSVFYDCHRINGVRACCFLSGPVFFWCLRRKIKVSRSSTVPEVKDSPNV